MNTRKVLVGALLISCATLYMACSEGSTPSHAGAGSGRATLVALPSSVVVATLGNQVVAYGPDGKQGWSLALPNNDTAAAQPAAALSSVTYIRGAQGLYAVAPDGKLLWQAAHTHGGDSVKGITSLADSTVAITGGDNSLIGYTAQGQVKWTFTLPDGDKLTDAPVLAASSIVYLRSEKKLYAVDSQGNLAWQAELGAPAS